MHLNNYLYNTTNVPTIPEEVINTRIELLNANLTKLLAEPWQTRNAKRVSAVLKAISFWRNLQ